MTWPVSTVATTHLDSDTDSVLSARAELKAMADALNEIISHLTGQTIWTSTTDGPTSGLSAQQVGGLNVKVVDIGDWNMDSTGNVFVTHGIADFTKIRSFTAIVRSDDNAQYFDLVGGSGASHTGAIAVTSSTFRLDRTAGAAFDSTSFDSTSFNRGWVTVFYTD